MSYDFTPTHHIGYTPEGYLICGKRSRKPKPQPKRTGPFVGISDGALRLECAKGNPEAVAEFEHRLRNSQRF